MSYEGGESSTTPLRERVGKITGHWWFRMVFVPWLVSRAVLSIIGALALYMIPPGTFSHTWVVDGSGQIETIQKGTWPQPKRWFVNSWARWDSWWYYSIAQYGYGHRQPGAESGETNLNFFPVYPLLMHSVKLLGNPPPVRYLEMGLLISNAALLGLLTLLVKLVRLDHDEATARGAALALLVFPSTLYLSAVYVESLFLLLVVAAFFAARKGQWWLAGLLAALITATRPPGVIIGPALLVEYLAPRGWRWRAIRPDILWLALTPLGIASVFAYQHFILSHGDVLSGYQTHKRFLTWPWVAFAPYFDGSYSSLRWEGSLLDLIFTVFLFAMSLLAFRLRASYGFFSAASVFFVMCTAGLSGMPRFGLTFFPVFILLGLAMRRDWFERAWLCSCSMLAAFFMALFASWHFYM
ncbi:MAG: mannosyltransferase family protein [Chthoniobacteraceae bacterium]